VSQGFLKVIAPYGYNVATMADGVVEHGAYHAGQIVLLRKEIQARRSRATHITDMVW
jgi:hypothetical protein